jgi:hypothetical protein
MKPPDPGLKVGIEAALSKTTVSLPPAKSQVVPEGVAGRVVVVNAPDD